MSQQTINCLKHVINTLLKESRYILYIGLLGTFSVLNAQDIIENDTLWTDTNGELIKASMGGHITQFGDTYYWVGNDPDILGNGGDIHLYSSKTLGSSSWKHEGMLVDFAPGEGHRNCTLLKSAETGNYVIVTKSNLRFYECATINGTYELVNTIDKNDLGGRVGYKVGGMSAYQEGDEAYVVISRRYLLDDSRHRFTAIYKLTPDFTDVQEEILWLRNDKREAMWLFKKDDLYYMSASHTAGWTPSPCYYRTATDLAGPWSEEFEIGMNPEPSSYLEQSHGTQHRYIMQVGDQWIYGGDRYPFEEPESYDLEKGFNVMCPVIWNGDHPIVQWEDSWEINTSKMYPLIFPETFDEDLADTLPPFEQELIADFDTEHLSSLETTLPPAETGMIDGQVALLENVNIFRNLPTQGSCAIYISFELGIEAALSENAELRIHRVIGDEKTIDSLNLEELGPGTPLRVSMLWEFPEGTEKLDRFKLQPINLADGGKIYIDTITYGLID